MKFSQVVSVIKPQYVFLKLKPNNSIRNQSTHFIARTISTLYRSVFQSIVAEEKKIIKLLGREFLIGTKYNFQVQGKIGYYIYIEKKKIEFYFIIPKQYLSIIQEKISDVWKNITIEEITDLPQFGEKATKYQLVYEKEDALSLKVDRRDNDLLQSNLNIVDVLEEGDKVAIFYNFMPASQESFKYSYKTTLEKVKKGLPVDRNKMGLAYLFKLSVGIIDGLVKDVSEILAGDKKKEGETWLETIVDRLQGGQKQLKEGTENKIKNQIVPTQIVILSESASKLRELNNSRSLANSFDVISEDNKLVPKRMGGKLNLFKYNLGAEVNKVSDLECQNFLSLAGRELLERHNFIEKVETQETEVPEDLRKGVLRIGENIFRGMKQQAYLSTDKEYKQLTLVLIGPTRAGKSTLIGNLSYDAIKNGECVVLFDFIKNCELSDEVAALFPPDKRLFIECHDFKSLQGLGYNEIPSSADPFIRYANAKKMTTQLITLVDSINSDDTTFSARMNRYMTSAALTVFLSGGNVKEVFSVLQNHNKRADYISKVPSSQLENMEEYIGYLRELDEKDKKGVITGTKLHLVEGIISRLNRLKDNPYMELMLKKGTENNINLVEEVQKNQLICIKMPETMFSTDNERDVYTTYWMTKIYLALQVRSENIPDRNDQRKVNLIIDELYQVQNTEQLLKQRLSRMAKFGMKPIISCHYLNQIKHIRDELRSANASYMLISGCDKENFKELKSELYPFTEEDLLKLPRYHSMNLIKCKDGYGKFITKLPAPVDQMEVMACEN
ncbi:MAG: hypothetical protein K0S25_44 [Bacillus sp. (in: firmicutes)]|jgi:hypothetical protein|nr:hypothetical protein [Bacillus sp. (in: firmicutes)]